MRTQTDIATAHASKYLQQLCKHWSHKMAVVFTPDVGLIPFAADARAHLRADAAALHVEIEAPSAETCARLGQVVFDHLKRFAFREELADPAWTAAA